MNSAQIDNSGTLCPYCEEYAKPHGWIKVEQDAAHLRAVMQTIKDTVYAKDQDEITRLNDIYDVCSDALKATA